MGLLDAIAGLQKMAEDPNLGNAAMSIGQAASDMPKILVEMKDLLGSLVREAKLTNSRLVEISLGLDGINDPVKRPPFHAEDVEAAMRGAWPPHPDKGNADG